MAVDTLTASTQVAVRCTPSVTGDLSNPTRPLDIVETISLTSAGTGANQGDQFFYDTRTIAAGGDETLDLSGSLVNGLGQTIAFTKIRFGFIRITSSTGGPLLIGGAASNAWAAPFGDTSDKQRVRRMWLLATGDATAYAVVAGTADQLKIENEDGSNAVTYDIVLIGSE